MFGMNFGFGEKPPKVEEEGEKTDVEKVVRPVDAHGRVLSEDEIKMNKEEQEKVGTVDSWREQK